MITDKKEHILKTAEDLFSEKGFEGASIRDIAAAANVNVAMISYYFGSKEKLFEEMVYSRTSYIREIVEQLNKTETDPWKKIEALINIYVDKILTHTHFHKILYREISLGLRSEVNASICEILSKNAGQLSNIINDGIAKKVFKKVDVPCTIATFIGTINYTTQSKNLVCRVMGVDPENYSLTSEEHRTRLKKHLKNLMKAHLGIN